MSKGGDLALADSLRRELDEIPIVNDHTHIFGTGEVDDYEAPGRWAANLTPEGLIAGLSGSGMNETASMRLLDDPERLRRFWLDAYRGRRSIYPVRAMTRFVREHLGLDFDEITLDNAPDIVAMLRQRAPVGTDALYAHIGDLSNTDVWFCNHGNLATLDRCCERTTRGRFRWVPYAFSDARSLDATARDMGYEPPRTASEIREVMHAILVKAKSLGAVAIKGGAFAYSLMRPFAPDVSNEKRLESLKAGLDLGYATRQDALAFSDALAVVTCDVAGQVGLPVQIHVGLIWSASGPTRIPEIMDLTPLFYRCAETTFVVFHGGFPRSDDLAHVAATMSNVRAEFNWVPYWAGADFAHLIGRWIDMIPNDRILYGTDAGGFPVTPTHDWLTREALAVAFAERIQRGLLSRRLAREIAAGILRNNAIDTYALDLKRC